MNGNAIQERTNDILLASTAGQHTSFAAVLVAVEEAGPPRLQLADHIISDLHVPLYIHGIIILLKTTIWFREAADSWYN